MPAVVHPYITVIMYPYVTSWIYLYIPVMIYLCVTPGLFPYTNYITDKTKPSSLIVRCVKVPCLRCVKVPVFTAGGSRPHL